MKNYDRWQSKISLIFVALLLVLLPTLALLQYKWLGQVSEAEKERMQATLRSAANNFVKDFNREITSVYFSFNKLKPNEPSEKQDPTQEHIKAYQNWLSKTQHPQLIKELYFADTTSAEKTLLKFSAQSTSFQVSEWPKEILSLKEKFVEKHSEEVNIDNGHFNVHTNVPFIPEIPAIVITNSELPGLPKINLNKDNANVVVNLKIPTTYLFILLDINYIKEKWLPTLTNQYFSSNNQLDYNIAILTETSNNIIYLSNQQLKQEEFSSNDIKLSLFYFNPEGLDKFFSVDESTNVQTIQPIPISNQPIVEQITEKKTPNTNKVEVIKSKNATVQIMQSSSFNVRSSQTQKQSVVKMFSFTKNDESFGCWSLIVKHRAGSLDTAIANLRQRNLIVSSGILLLLAISMGMILVSTRRAQSLAKQQMEFVAGVSHELRTPLAVICSAGENLADGVVSKPEQIKRYGSLIKGEGRRLSNMVEQILEFAGWQSHKKSYQIQPTNINTILESAILACKPLITETNTEIVTSIPSSLPLVNADPAALQRALQNLIVNAIKYSKDIKWIEIISKFHSKTSKIEISITDKGIGIAPKELPYIFEPFYRGQEVIDAQIHGSGLGLSLVKQIVNACGGTVTVTSLLKQGSTFTVLLPLAETKKETITSSKFNDGVELYE